jgi:histone acetyltransferase (RNA polymerase elongator complex component)
LSLDLNNILKNIINKENQYTIPIFIPHLGCKNDCVFCNQRKITGVETSISVNDVEKLIIENLSYFKDKKNEKKIEVAFFGGSFTGIPEKKQIEYLEVANKYLSRGEIHSIRLSTRPDYISPKILNMLKKYNVGTIELGVQSMDDEVLKASKRGHLKKDVIRAARLISLYNINLGIQIMVGLPKSTLEKEISTIKDVLKLDPQVLRIYPVYVLKDSKLYDMYEEKEYIPLNVKDAVDRVYHILKECKKTNVKVIRIGLQSTNEITSSNDDIVGPVCDNFAEYAMSKIVLDEIENYICTIQSKENCNMLLNIYVPNKYASVVVGPKKINKIYLKDKYNITIKIKGENK